MWRGRISPLLEGGGVGGLLTLKSPDNSRPFLIFILLHWYLQRLTQLITLSTLELSLLLLLWLCSFLTSLWPVQLSTHQLLFHSFLFKCRYLPSSSLTFCSLSSQGLLLFWWQLKTLLLSWSPPIQYLQPTIRQCCLGRSSPLIHSQSTYTRIFSILGSLHMLFPLSDGVLLLLLLLLLSLLSIKPLQVTIHMTLLMEAFPDYPD